MEKIKELYEEDRPYEKCVRFGAENLTDAELLAVLLRTGTRGGYCPGTCAQTTTSEYVSERYSEYP